VDFYSAAIGAACILRKRKQVFKGEIQYFSTPK